MNRIHLLLVIIIMIMTIVACSKDNQFEPDYPTPPAPQDTIVPVDTTKTDTVPVIVPDTLPVPAYTVNDEWSVAPSKVNAIMLEWIKKIVTDESKGKNYTAKQIIYETPDQSGQLVKASAIVTIPDEQPIQRVYLVNHGTHIGNLMVPTSGIYIEETIASAGALCVFPDYIGLGASTDLPELYLNANVHGSTSTDALLVLLDYAKKSGINLNDDFGTYIMGYSQGGSVTLATLRHIQQMPEGQQKLLHLKKVFCGDGPYNLRTTFETYMDDYKQGKKMGLATVIPMVLSSMFHSYPEEVKSIEYKDLFTTKAWLTGVPKAVYENKANLVDVMLLWMNFDLGDVLNMKYIDSHPEQFDLLLQLMERQDLTKGWELKYPTRFLHANPDDVVPFSNYESAEQGLKNEMFESEIIYPEEGSNPLKQHGAGMTTFIKRVMNGDF